MTGDGGKILEFKPAPEGAILEAPIKLRRSPHCSHGVATVDEVKRVVTCERCGAVLDPVDALVVIARHFDRAKLTLDHLTTEAARKAAELEELRRKVANARAQLRRLNKPSSDGGKDG